MLGPHCHLVDTTGTSWPVLGRGGEGDVGQRPNLHTFISVQCTGHLILIYIFVLIWATLLNVVMSSIEGNPGNSNISWGWVEWRELCFHAEKKWRLVLYLVLRSQKKKRNRTESLNTERNVWYSLAIISHYTVFLSKNASIYLAALFYCGFPGSTRSTKLHSMTIIATSLGSMESPQQHYIIINKIYVKNKDQIVCAKIEQK